MTEYSFWGEELPCGVMEKKACGYYRLSYDKLHRLDSALNSPGGHSSGKAGDWICTSRGDRCRVVCKVVLISSLTHPQEIWEESSSLFLCLSVSASLFCSHWQTFSLFPLSNHNLSLMKVKSRPKLRELSQMS